MSPAVPRRFDLALRRHNLAPLMLACGAASALLAWRAAGRADWAGEQPPSVAARVRAARERIDPNLADGASLRRLPGIGVAMAQRIVEWRRAEQARGVSRPFRTADDLRKVRGIGPVLAARLAPLLALPPAPAGAYEGPAQGGGAGPQLR